MYLQKTYITNHLSHPIILGRDFLSKYALSINFSTFQLTLSDNSNSEANQNPTQECFNVIDVSDKIPSFEEPRPRLSCPNLFNSSHTLQSDSDDLSETFMHNLEERCSDFQSVNSISQNLTDVSDSSEFSYPYFRLPSFKHVVLLCVFFAISLTVLFQITKDQQILFSRPIDSYNGMNFHSSPLTRIAYFETTTSRNSIQLSQMTFWKDSIDFLRSSQLAENNCFTNNLTLQRFPVQC